MFGTTCESSGCIATANGGKRPRRPRDRSRRGAVTAAADPGRLGPQPCFGHATSMSAAAASVSACADIAHVAAPRLPPSCVPAVAARLPRQAGRSPRSGGGSSPSESGALAAMLDPAGCSSRLVLGRRRESFRAERGSPPARDARAVVKVEAAQGPAACSPRISACCEYLPQWTLWSAYGALALRRSD